MVIYDDVSKNYSLFACESFFFYKWTFYRQLEEEDGSLNTDSWFPNVLKNYEAFVKYSYNIEKPTKDETAYLREYLRDDLQVDFFIFMLDWIY